MTTISKSQSHTKSKKTDKQDSLNRLTEIENSPFRLYKKDNDKYIIILGDIQMNKKEFKNKEDAEKSAQAINWDNIMAVIFATVQLINSKNQN